MRIYLAPDSIRFAGKAWELRHYLKQLKAAAPAGTTVRDWLQLRTSWAGRHAADAERAAGAASGPELTLAYRRPS